MARRLRKLLFLKPRAKFDRENGRIEVSGIPLEHLSDGNQSVLALAADMIAVMFSRWPAMEAAEGIVLMIDELGAHLHPRWRMRIVAAAAGASSRACSSSSRRTTRSAYAG